MEKSLGQLMAGPPLPRLTRVSIWQVLAKHVLNSESVVSTGAAGVTCLLGKLCV